MNSVTIDASHYERLVRDSVKYEQIRVAMIKSVRFSKWFDRMNFDEEIIHDSLETILSTSEFNDLKYRYEYLKQQYEAEEKKKAEAKKEQEEPNNGESTL